MVVQELRRGVSFLLGDGLGRVIVDFGWGQGLIKVTTGGLVRAMGYSSGKT